MIKIGIYYIQQNELTELTVQCKIITKEYQQLWNKQFKTTLQQWHEDPLKIYVVDSLDELVYKILLFLQTGEEVEAIIVSQEQMLRAKELRNIHRLGRIYELASKQISLIAPDIKYLSPDQFLPLDHHWKGEQQQRWQRTKSGQYVQLKPKKENNETEVSIFGNPKNPSMVYWRYTSIDDKKEGRQLGHRYQATSPLKRAPLAFQTQWALLSKGYHSFNDTDDRTYGGKGIKKSTGKYKVDGMVDGHAIQARDDQVNLDLKQRSIYPTADRHPHNMYWENKAFGAKVRQDIFEEYAYNNESWMLQVNEYSNYDNPTKLPTHAGNMSKPSDVIVPDRIHIQALYENQIGYWQFNNKQGADYGDLRYRVENEDYKVVPYSRILNTNLGVISSGNKSLQHARANKRPSGEIFPAAQIINIHENNFDSKFGFRSQIPGYQTPPSTPNYLSFKISSPVDVKCFNGHLFEGAELDQKTQDDITTVRFVSELDEKRGATLITISHNASSNSELWKRRRKKIILPEQKLKEPDPAAVASPDPPEMTIQLAEVPAVIKHLNQEQSKSLIYTQKLNDLIEITKEIFKRLPSRFSDISLKKNHNLTVKNGNEIVQQLQTLRYTGCEFLLTYFLYQGAHAPMKIEWPVIHVILDYVGIVNAKDQLASDHLSNKKLVTTVVVTTVVGSNKPDQSLDSKPVINDFLLGAIFSFLYGSIAIFKNLPPRFSNISRKYGAGPNYLGAPYGDQIVTELEALQQCGEDVKQRLLRESKVVLPSLTIPQKPSSVRKTLIFGDESAKQIEIKNRKPMHPSSIEYFEVSTPALAFASINVKSVETPLESKSKQLSIDSIPLFTPVKAAQEHKLSKDDSYLSPPRHTPKLSKSKSSPSLFFNSNSMKQERSNKKEWPKLDNFDIDKELSSRFR